MATIIENSRSRGTAITPSDSTNIEATRSIYIGGTGALKVTMSFGDTLTFATVGAGVIYTLSVTKIWSTGTTATGIIALY